MVFTRGCLSSFGWWRGISACLRCCAALALIASTAYAEAEPPAASPNGASTASAPLPEDSQPILLPEVVVEVPRPGKALHDEAEALDRSREEFLLPALGADSASLDAAAIDSLPSGENAAISSLVLQLPGVSADARMSSISFHLRNEYANVQYRIDGVALPDGLSGFSDLLDTGMVGHVRLLDGALPAHFGLRTAGVIDVTTKSEYPPQGLASLYLGTPGTISPGLEYGGQAGSTQYFLSGRFLRGDEGLDSATPAAVPRHDGTEQWHAFGYQATMLGESTRLISIAGLSSSHFQIPDLRGGVPQAYYGDPSLSSAALDENQFERFAYAVLALQTAGERGDAQLSVSSRYAMVHFRPDPYGDLVFDSVASDVRRQSLLLSSQLDGARRLGQANTLRAGYVATAEGTRVGNISTVLPIDGGGTVLPDPVTVSDVRTRVGWLLGGYLEDELRLATHLTLDAGLRYDRVRQFTSAGQLSPRVALLYQPISRAALHLGYARYFTPPGQAEATPTTLSLFEGTTLQPAVALGDRVRPERSHYFDLGAEIRPVDGLDLTASVYYKRATDMLDDGQFGEAAVLTQLNYSVSYSRGAELGVKFGRGPISAHGNVSLATTRAKGVATNQYLLDGDEYAYLQSHYHATDDAQGVTASAWASCLEGGVLVSLDGLYGSGLPSGFANTGRVPGHAALNAAVARELDPLQSGKPLTLRVGATNLLDARYLLRSGTGIGQEAPQYGARRAVFVSLSQRL